MKKRNTLRTTSGEKVSWVKATGMGEMAEADVPDCPVETALIFIDSKWRVLILRDLMGGKMRFSEFWWRLAEGSHLQSACDGVPGLLTRTVYAEVPPRVDDELTDLGRSLHGVLDALERCGASCQEQVASSAR
ncbi:winged helix-turn-helix transcriptional regulator [Cutibacterium sp. V947]|uniref:winged helix-turn-helix transcriptional regulator n=1 Tax=Cutibacterium sp. V947 TaxID=3446480 RepID=UPI003EE0246C